MAKLMQGDSYKIEFSFTKDGAPLILSADDVAAMRISLGDFTKHYPAEQGETAEEVIYTENNKWYFPFTQEESQKLEERIVPIQVRVKLNSGDVFGVSAGFINIDEAINREVL